MWRFGTSAPIGTTWKDAVGPHATGGWHPFLGGSRAASGLDLRAVTPQRPRKKPRLSHMERRALPKKVHLGVTPKLT